MRLRICLAMAMTAIACTVTSCAVDTHTPTQAAATSTSSPTVTTSPTQTSTPALAAAAAPGSVTSVAPGVAEITLPPQGGEAPHPATTMFVSQPIPDSELTDSRTAKQIRYEASRLKAHVGANGVPADWANNGLDYISVLYTPEEVAAWDKEIMVGFQGNPDGSFTLRGWSQTGADPKYTSYNTGLEYDSVKGFVTG